MVEEKSHGMKDNERYKKDRKYILYIRKYIFIQRNKL